jgi:predicted RNA-binding protein YlqC (UPF0109 family)
MKWLEVIDNCIIRSFITCTLQVKKDDMGGACSTKGEKRNAYRILVGKLEGKRSLGKQT